MSDWKFNEEEKQFNRKIFGGDLVLFRREDTGKLFAKFDYAPEVGEDTPDEERAQAVSIQIPLHHVERVAQAQDEAVHLLRETLDKNGYTFHRVALTDTSPDLI